MGVAKQAVMIRACQHTDPAEWCIVCVRRRFPELATVEKAKLRTAEATPWPGEIEELLADLGDDCGHTAPGIVVLRRAVDEHIFSWVPTRKTDAPFAAIHRERTLILRV